jgi:uncharacterized membrane protein
MAGDVWESTEHGRGAFDPEAPVAAAELPRVGEVLTESLNALTSDLKGHFLAGLGFTLAMVPLAIAAAIGLYLSLIPGILYAAATDEPAMGIVGMFMGFSVGMTGILVLVVGVSGPLTASLYRALWANLVDGTPLTIGSAFSTMFHDIGRVFTLVALQMVLTLAGALFCYVPALGVAAALHMALPSLVVSGLGPIAAMRASARVFRAHPGWAFGTWALGFAILLVASNIPLVGNALGMPLYATYQLRLYRRVFAVSRA